MRIVATISKGKHMIVFNTGNNLAFFVFNSQLIQFHCFSIALHIASILESETASASWD
jgi:hypothetical protein